MRKRIPESPSRQACVCLGLEELTMILACLGEVHINDMRVQQSLLQMRLSQSLKKMAPIRYAALVKLGKIGDAA